MLGAWLVLMDIVCYVLHFLPLILLVIPVQIWAFRELRSERQWGMVMIAIAGLAALVAAACWLARIPGAVSHDWTPIRLVPAIAWSKGYHLYYPADQGPVFVQLYGPVSAMVYLPAALAAHPTAAILIGVFMDTLFYFLPAAWFFYSSLKNHRDSILIFAAFAGFALLSLRQFVLAEAATRVTIDAPAIGLSVCAMAVLVGGKPSNPWGAGALCGLFAALSIWTKPTLAPISLVLIAFFALFRGRADVLRFAVALCGVILLISAMLIFWFGRDMLFQMIAVPMRQPWQWDGAPTRVALVRAARWIWRYMRPFSWESPLWIALVVLVGGVGPRGMRQWFRRSSWLLPLVAAVAVLPTSTIAYAKAGGAWNNAIACASFLLLASMMALAGGCASTDHTVQTVPWRARVLRVAFASFLLANSWMSFDSIIALRKGLADWTRVSENDNEAAFAYAQAHPGQAYFPFHPLATLLAESRLDHADAGFFDRDMARLAISDQQLHGWLPPHVQAIILSKGQRARVQELLPEFSHPVNIPELPGWTGFTRDGNLPQ